MIAFLIKLKRKYSHAVKCFCILAFVTAMFLTGCAAIDNNNTEKTATRELFAMDTYMTLTGYGEDAEAAVDEACEEIKRLESMLSSHDENSEIYLLNKTGHAILSEDAAELVQLSCQYSEATGGAYDATVYPIIKIWGFADGEFRVPSDAEIAEALKLVDYRSVQVSGDEVTLAKGQGIDLGGIAKGYTSARIMDIFKKHNLEGGVVSLGGNVQFYGKKATGDKWSCGIRAPFENANATEVLGTVRVTVRVTDKAVITSGGYERFFEDSATGEKYQHIIDTKTGRPASGDLISVTIVTADGTMGDALSTALYAMGREAATDFYQKSGYDFDMILVDRSGKVYVSENICEDFESDYEIIKVEK